MKKLFTMTVLALMTVVMAVAVTGCGTDSEAIDRLTKRIDALEKESEELEKENNNLQNQFNNLNVFWADKKEYSEMETMTIYFRDTAVYKIRLSFDTLSGKPFDRGGKYAFNGDFCVTGLCSDIYSSEIIGASFIEWDEGVSTLDSKYQQLLIQKDIETRIGAAYYGSSPDYSVMTWLDFVICVPGTHVELARFKNVSFSL